MSDITTILGVRVTYIHRVDDLPYCEFIRLVERELGAVKGQLDILQAEIDSLHPLLVSREAKQALYEARAWYIDAVQEWSIWRNMYAELSLKGKADMTLNQVIRYHNETVIPFFHPNAEQQAELHIAIKAYGYSPNRAVMEVMIQEGLLDAWKNERAEHWKEVLNV